MKKEFELEMNRRDIVVRYYFSIEENKKLEKEFKAEVTDEVCSVIGLSDAQKEQIKSIDDICDITGITYDDLSDIATSHYKMKIVKQLSLYKDSYISFDLHKNSYCLYNANGEDCNLPNISFLTEDEAYEVISNAMKSSKENIQKVFMYLIGRNYEKSIKDLPINSNDKNLLILANNSLQEFINELLKISASYLPGTNIAKEFIKNVSKDLDIEIGKMLTCVVSANSYIAGSYHAAEVKLNDKTYFIYPFSKNPFGLFKLIN